MIVKIAKKNNKNNLIPIRATGGSAGFDLFADLDEPLILSKGEGARIPCGISIELPSKEYVALIFPRSGLANKHGITLINSVGVIDSDYRGEIQVGLIKLFGDEPYEIKPCDRIAQMIITRIEIPEFKLVNMLRQTLRGTGGFGSTGD